MRGLRFLCTLHFSIRGMDYLLESFSFDRLSRARRHAFKGVSFLPCHCSQSISPFYSVWMLSTSLEGTPCRNHLLPRNNPTGFECTAGYLADTSNRPASTEDNNRITVAEEGIFPQPSWTLPQKISNHGLTLGSDPEESHPRALFGIFSAKRLKGPFTSPLSSPLSSYNNVSMTESSRSCLDFSEADTGSAERAAPAEAISDHLDSERPQTLRSPFEYTQVLVTSQVDPPIKDDMQQFSSKMLGRSDNTAGYIYYAPTNPSEEANRKDAPRRVPRRQLSYGNPPSKPGPRSLHKTPGLRGLRHEAERHAEEYDLGSWSDSTSGASAARPFHSEPMRRKPRLWLDLSEQKDNIQEAVSNLELQANQNQCRKSR